MRRTADRFRARRRAARRRVTLALALTGASLATLGWIVLASPLLVVERVSVQGTQLLSAAQVLAAAKVPRVSMVVLQPGRIARRVASLPAVATVSVDRRWPHRIVIAVHERQAVAVVTNADGDTLVDKTGVAFATVPAAASGLLPVTADVAVPGPEDPSTRAAMQVWAALPAVLRTQVRAIRAPSADAVSLVLSGGRIVTWGSASDADRKLAVLHVLMAHRERLYDVSTPGVAVTD